MSGDGIDQRRRIGLILSTYFLRLIGQGVSFFLFAKALGTNNFGFVVVSLAIISPLSPLVDMGAYSIVSRDIILGRPPLIVIGENISTMLITLPLALLFALVFAYFTNPTLNLFVLFLIGIAYLSISRTSLLLASIQNTISQRIPVIVIEGISALSLIMLGIYGIRYHYNLLEWAYAYAFIGIMVMLFSLLLIRRYIGNFKLNDWPTRDRIKEGLIFSFGGTFQYIYTDADKSILLHFASPGITGVFGMASRIGAVSLIPIGAIYSFFYPRFMKSGKGLDMPINNLLWKVISVSTLYSIFLVTIFIFVIPLLLKFLGSEYVDVPNILKILSISIVFQVFQTPFADAITGMGFQLYRTYVQSVACAISVVGGLVMIPSNPKAGVIHLNIAVHGFLLIAYVAIYVILLRSYKSKMM